MKKLAIFIFVLAFIVCIAITSKVEAISITVIDDITAVVNPTLGGGPIDNDNGSTTFFPEVEYKVVPLGGFDPITGVDDPNITVDWISIEFETDIFTPISKGQIDNVSPGDWNVFLTSDNVLSIGGTPLALGDTFSFTVTDLELQTVALEVGGLSVFEQTVNLTGQGSNNSFAFGGSSTVPNPEPGTMVLMGIGLAGLVGMGIKRKMKKKD